MDNMLCPICGGTIYIDPSSDHGSCDTCEAVFVDGIVYEEDGGNVYAGH